MQTVVPLKVLVQGGPFAPGANLCVDGQNLALIEHLYYCIQQSQSFRSIYYFSYRQKHSIVPQVNISLFSRFYQDQMKTRKNRQLNLQKGVKPEGGVKTGGGNPTLKTTPKRAAASQFLRAGREEIKRGDNKDSPVGLKQPNTPAKKRDPRDEETNIRTASLKKDQGGELGLQPKKRQLSKQLFGGKTKPIEKKEGRRQMRKQYRCFYQLHFKQLQEEHPSWTNKQITTVTSLLWKRSNKTITSPSQEQLSDLVEGVLSGREAFRERKTAAGYSDIQIEGMWRRLPAEAKKLWQQEGNGLKKGRRANKMDRVKFGPTGALSSETNPLSFLHSRMG